MPKLIEPGFYILGEDFAPGSVGPFPTIEHAARHLLMQIQRNDAACFNHKARIIHSQLFSEIDEQVWDMNNSSPENDLN